MHAYWMIALQSIPGFIVCLHVAIGPAFSQHHAATVSTQAITWWYCHGYIDEQAAEEYNFSTIIVTIIDCMCMFQMKKCL